MTTIYLNTVASVSRAPLLVVLCPEDQFGWCKQVEFHGAYLKDLVTYH